MRDENGCNPVQEGLIIQRESIAFCFLGDSYRALSIVVGDGGEDQCSGRKNRHRVHSRMHTRMHFHSKDHSLGHISLRMALF